MITWDYLVQCVEKLQTLPNGGGSEIDFTYRGEEYGIVSYHDSAEISVIPKRTFDNKKTTYSKEEIHRFKSLRELGSANIYGFVLEEIWNCFTEEDCSIRPDFNDDYFEAIFEVYEKACKEKR